MQIIRRVDRLEEKKQKRKKWFRILAIIGILLLLFLGYVGYNLYQAFGKGQDNSIGKSDMRDQEVQPKETPFAVLLMGVDQIEAADEKKDGWRPDVLMVAAVNPKTKSVKMVSIPRDTLVTIGKTGGKDKINSAAAYGRKKGNEIEVIRQTVENFLQIPIDYYVKINYQGFVDIVDAVNGVDVQVEYPFRGPAIHQHISFQEGPAHLNGMQALAYVRQRKDSHNTTGDHDRNKRQQEVLADLTDKLVSVVGISKFPKITESVGNNFSYNLTLSDLLSIGAVYKSIPKANIESYTIKTTPQQYDSRGRVVWWEIASKEERERVQTMLQTQLEWQEDSTTNEDSTQEEN
ncbi:LCP family protein [Risungbinella massiliensis]|uniref:LCP family protein n=1 Tax=Risungbinella massiliensis TaxID=1329796 RepID=UPI0005CC46C8|nr:LCP family protein [Risungbinella massiliensis]